MPPPPQPREKVSSIDLEIDSLSSLLDDMTKNDPFKARVSSGYVPPPVATPFIPKSSTKPATGGTAPLPPGRHLPAPSPCPSLRAKRCSMSSPRLSPRPSPRPSLRSSCMCSLSPRLIPSLCLRLTRSPEVLQLHLQHQPLSFLQWLPSLLPWLPSSALEPPVALGHSPVKSWDLRKLLLPLARVPLNPPASPMLSRKRSPACRRSSTQCPHLLRSKTRYAPLGPRDR